MENKKINFYIIVIVVLLLIIAVFAYKQWGNDFLSKIFKKEVGDEIELIIGSDDAPVEIIEYYSYVCSYCKSFEDDIKPQIMESYIIKGKAKFILRPFPPYELGQAVLCANDQGKFLEYHNYLFNNTSSITSGDSLIQFAKNIGLNEEQFSTCLSSKKYEAKSKQWYEQGKKDFAKNNISEDKMGTPSFLIDGELLIGAQPYEKFVEIIERKLK